MNEITESIKKKAEEKYPLSNKNYAKAYTCGGEDAIVKHILSDDGFLFWAAFNGYRMEFDNLIGLSWYEEDKQPSPIYSTKELLTKYMEDNKL